jgi:hypothetical protein
MDYKLALAHTLIADFLWGDHEPFGATISSERHLAIPKASDDLVIIVNRKIVLDKKRLAATDMPMFWNLS